MRFDHIASRLEPVPPERSVSPCAEAAVAVVFRRSDAPSSGGATACAGPEATDLLFIQRAERHGDPWSGHMAFPGGRREDGDVSLHHTAVRETREELALDLAEAGRPLGALPAQEALPSDDGWTLWVQPLVFGLWSPFVPLRANDEVASFHWVPLLHLVSGEARDTIRWRYRGRELELPCIWWEGRCIWGLTLRMVEELLRRLDLE